MLGRNSIRLSAGRAVSDDGHCSFLSLQDAAKSIFVALESRSGSAEKAVESAGLHASFRESSAAGYPGC
jgi:hypothetical protein